ncbi:MAG: thioester domain-containing protein, partial [Pseudomonadota bacterium]|nr:thioester domain-containing protein [Pseudomonadota bacterium]
MKNSWVRRGMFMALSLVASAALGNAFSGVNPAPGNLVWNGASDGYVTVSTSGGTFSTGQFQGSFDPTSEADAFGAEADDFFRFFCVDISHAAVTGPTSYTRILGLDVFHNATDAAELTRLFNAYYPNGAIGTYYAGGSPTAFGSFGGNATNSAAFQLAVWEIWFDTDNNLNLSGGSFQASPSAVTTLAQSWLNAIGNGSTFAPGWTLYEFVSTNTPLSQN